MKILNGATDCIIITIEIIIACQRGWTWQGFYIFIQIKPSHDILHSGAFHSVELHSGALHSIELTLVRSIL